MAKPLSKRFRRFTLCVVATVVSSYAVLIILVVSHHLDAQAERELRQLAAAAVNGGGSARLGSVLQHRRQALLPGASGSPAESRVQGRRYALARMLADDARVFSRTRRLARVCSEPKYRVPPGPVVALASFPGSGNTWIRYLVQQVTGYLTGSVYRDYSLLRNGFPAESVINGSVILVKTHEWGPSAKRSFDKAILLVRDPYGALLAEFNRRAGGHLGHASPERFKKGKSWPDFVSVHINSWMNTILDWLEFQGPLHLVIYEDIVKDLSTELLKIIRFLNVTVPWKTFHCVLKHRDGAFRRPNVRMTFDPFDPPMREVIEKCRLTVQTAIENHRRKSRLKGQLLVNVTLADWNRTMDDAFTIRWTT